MSRPYAGPASCDLSPDANAMQAFVGWWFHYAMKGQIELGWMNPQRGGLTNFRLFEIGDETLVTFAAQVNAIPGQSVYIRASTVAPANFGKTTDADFVQGMGAWNDLDTPEQVAYARGVKTIIRPNAGIVTGRHPHLRTQSFIRCDEPINDGATVWSLNNRLRALYGGDPAVVNPTRLMRLPGTIAWPWKAGRTPELTQFVLLDDGRPKEYTLDALLAGLPKEAEPEQPRAGGAEWSGSSLDRVADLIRAIQAGHNWHDNVVRLVAHWVGRGWSNAEIQTASEAFTLAGYTAQQTRDEVNKAIEGARRKWGVPNEDHTLGDTPPNPFSEQVIDPWDTLQAPAFPIHTLPSILRAFVEGRARAMGADPCAIAWAAISACSAALPGQMRMQMKRHDPWSVPPAIWTALVGRSSTKKTPIINAAWAPLERQQNAAIRNWQSQMGNWKSMSKREREDTLPPPQPRRLISHDATMEGLQDILSNQDRGIGVLRDELAGFIAGMDKYSGGKGGGSDRAFFLQAYNGGSHVVDRVGRGTTAINNLLVAICGGIQPDRLAQFTDLADDGLWQRFVPIIVSPSEMGEDAEQGDEVAAYDAMVSYMLDADGNTRGQFSEAAHDVRTQFERDIFELERSEPLGSKFASFVGKLPGLFGRLCLTLSFMEHGISPYIITERTANAARVLIMRNVLTHAARVYLTMGAGGLSNIETTQSVAGYVLFKRADRVLASDLTSGLRIMRKATLQQVQQAVSPLVAGGWVTPEKDIPGNRAWLVNPVVHVKFTDRAASEAVRRSKLKETIMENDYDDA